MARGPGGAAEAAEDDAALALTQLTRFYESLAGKGDIADILGEAFQVMRTDGIRFDRAGYIARHPSVSRYKLSDVKAIRSGDVLTASFFSAFNAEIEGIDRTTGGDPRLAIFTKVGDGWKLQAVANLGLGLAANQEAEGKKAIEAWVGAVVSGDLARIKAVLAPEFQIVRADGSAYDKAAYLASSLPKFDKPPEVKSPVVTGFGDYLIARYMPRDRQGRCAAADGLPQARQCWLVVAHANFAGLVGSAGRCGPAPARRSSRLVEHPPESTACSPRGRRSVADVCNGCGGGPKVARRVVGAEPARADRSVGRCLAADYHSCNPEPALFRVEPRWHHGAMNIRNQITLDERDAAPRRSERLRELGISFDDYMGLSPSDLVGASRPPHGLKPKADISAVFDLVTDGPRTNIARDKDKMIGEAVWKKHLVEALGRSKPPAPGEDESGVDDPC